MLRPGTRHDSAATLEMVSRNLRLVFGLTDRSGLTPEADKVGYWLSKP